MELYEYGGFNRMVRSRVNGEETTYTYRADGLRNSKTSTDGTTTHLWDGANIVADLNGSTVIARYVRGVNLLFSDSSAGQKFYLYNGHGDVAQLAGSTGTMLWRYDYDAFGNEREIAGQDPSLDANPFRYCGEYFDKETGSIYLRARYYSPVTGRFRTEDTHWNPGNMIYGDDILQLNTYSHKAELNTIIQSEQLYIYAVNKNQLPNIYAIMQSGNLYVYVMNNPLGFVDPSGEITLALGGEAAAAFLLKLGVSGQLVVDDKGNVGVLLAGEGGGGTPVASISGTFTMTNANTIFDLSGVGFGTGGSGAFGLPVSLGIDVLGGTAKDGTPVIGGQIAVGVSTPFPEGHGQLSYSGVISLNWLPSWFKNSISNLINGMYNMLTPEQQKALWDIIGG